MDRVDELGGAIWGGAKTPRVADEQGVNSFRSSPEKAMVVSAIRGCVALDDPCHIELPKPRHLISTTSTFCKAYNAYHLDS